MQLEKQILKDYPTWSDFVKDQSPEQLIVNYDFVNNYYDVYNTSPITLDLLTRLYPRKQSYAGYEYLERWLHFLNDFLNINKGMQSQVKQLSYMLYSRYKHFRLSDLKLLFNHILESRYGNFYGSIDTQRIMTSFFEYNRERGDMFAKIEEKARKEEERKALEKPAGPADLSKYKNIAATLQSGDSYVGSLAKRKSV